MALPIAAAPIAKMFLDAIGLSIAGLAAKDIVDVANKYIEANPDESMKILSTIIPNVGIGQIFMSKEDKISLEDLEDMTDEEAQDLSKEEKAELMKQAGKRRDRELSIATSEKIGLTYPDRKKQDIEYEIDERYDEGGVEQKKAPFDYTKFFRKRRADGGAIGIEVLFREKKNLGGLLTGQAKNIYDTMSAAGYFTEDEIRNAITGAGYEIPGASQSETTAPNIIGSQINQGGGGGGMTGLQETFTKDLSGNPRFNYLEPTAQANKYRFDRSVEPREGVMGFFDKIGNKFKESKFFQPKIRGTLGTRMANQPMIPLPAAIASYSRSPFNIKSPNYNPLMEAQLNFAETQEGLIGRDPNSGLLKYGPGSVLAGKNVFSFGGTNDPEKALMDYITKMNAYQKKKATDSRAAKIAKAEAELKALQEATEKARAAQYGAIDYGRGSDGQRSYSGDAIGAGNLGFGIGATTGGPVSNRTGRGRQDYSKGGLASMFVEKR